MRTRYFPESNYKSIFLDGKTLRIAINPNLPITDLKYPEFYDVKITNHCNGGCSYCYQNSTPSESHYENILEKFQSFFGKLDKNQLPYQIAFGGGEPTQHPDFCKLMELSHDMGIVPNYTTNGMNVTEEIVATTKKYCGGVAITAHSHLEKYWKNAIDIFHKAGCKVNIHIVLSDRKSIDDFFTLFDEVNDKIDYFVLLPYTVFGRAKEKTLAFDYLFKRLEDSPDREKIAFGANFYPYLKNYGKVFDISLYEPEIMSKYLDLGNMKVYGSSFSTKEIDSF